MKILKYLQKLLSIIISGHMNNNVEILNYSNSYLERNTVSCMIMYNINMLTQI